MFVGTRHATGVYAPHTYKIKQRSQHRLYRAAAYFTDFFGVLCIVGKFLVHAVVVRLVDAVVYFFELSYLAAAWQPQRTIFAIDFAAALRFFGVTLAVGAFAFVAKCGTVAARLGALILILKLVVLKSFTLVFVLPKVGNVGIDIISFVKRQSIVLFYAFWVLIVACLSTFGVLIVCVIVY